MNMIYMSVGYWCKVELFNYSLKWLLELSLYWELLKKSWKLTFVDRIKMGAGRKTEMVVMQNKPPSQQTSNATPWSARNMRKKDLAAVIFGCKHSTFNECIFKQLFGLPSGHIVYVQNVSVGMPLFLFNYSDRKLHGIFEATSPGQMCLSRHAWTLDGEEVTPFPAQVRVKVRMMCRPLTEEQFKPIIADNYSTHEPHHFWFELDQTQTNRLIELFSAFPVTQSAAISRGTAIWGNLFRQPPPPINYQEDSSVNGRSKQQMVGQEVVEKQGTVPYTSEGKSWSSLFKQSEPNSKKEDDDTNSEGVSNMSEDEVLPVLPEAIWVDGASPVMSDSISENQAPPTSEVLNGNEAPVVTEMTCVDEVPIPLEVIHFTEEISSEVIHFTEVSSEMNPAYYTAVNKLIQAIGEMNAFQLNQTRKIQSLEQNLIEANKRIQELESYHLDQGSGQSMSPHSTGHVEELQIKKPFQDSYHSMLLVGGFSGSSWLRDLDLFIPSEDVIQSLEPMGSVRSYSSAVKFKDSLYVLGGVNGTSWFDTVESYNLKEQQWMSCPSLSRKKGSLAGVSLRDKIYAIGGGDTTFCFSEVEVLDLDIGNWYFASSMQQKRFAPAAAQINGVLYVVGGYDGGEYLKSMERFDPREYSWTMLKNMNSRRGCHSMTVMNEKLYAIGGFDGAQMVPTVEVYEPRVGSWTMLTPMKYARGYMGSVTLGNTIYVIGGMQENEEILDIVECYSEGRGWELTDMKAIGKRCFFSAVAL